MRPGGSLHPIFGFWPDVEVTRSDPHSPCAGGMDPILQPHRGQKNRSMALTDVFSKPQELLAVGGEQQGSDCLQGRCSPHFASHCPQHQLPCYSPGPKPTESLQTAGQGSKGRTGRDVGPRHRAGTLPRDNRILISGREAGTAAVEEEDYDEREK